MRHGDAEGGMDDAKRPLSAKGRQEALLAGRFFKKASEIPGAIYHSSLLRARQTAEGVASELGASDRLCECAGLCPLDSPAALAADFAADFDENILIVSHLPFVERFASQLLAHAESTLNIRFTTGSILGVERTSSSLGWTLRFYATGKMLQRMQAPQ